MTDFESTPAVVATDEAEASRTGTFETGGPDEPGASATPGAGPSGASNAAGAGTDLLRPHAAQR